MAMEITTLSIYNTPLTGELVHSHFVVPSFLLYPVFLYQMFLKQDFNCTQVASLMIFLLCKLFLCWVISCTKLSWNPAKELCHLCVTLERIFYENIEWPLQSHFLQILARYHFCKYCKVLQAKENSFLTNITQTWLQQIVVQTLERTT